MILIFLNSKLPDKVIPDVLNNIADAIAENDKLENLEKSKQVDASSFVNKNASYLQAHTHTHTHIYAPDPSH